VYQKWAEPRRWVTARQANGALILPPCLVHQREKIEATLRCDASRKRASRG